MINDPVIFVECDICLVEEDVHLTRTARGWDDRNVKDELEADGWLTRQEDNVIICPDCVEDGKTWEDL